MRSNAQLISELHTKAYGEGNLDIVDRLVAPDYVEHDPMGLSTIEGREGYKRVVKTFRTAFPDLEIGTHETAEEGNLIGIRFTADGSHKGPLLAVEPTGNEVEMQGIDIGRVSGGQLQETWVQMSILELLQQLEVIPTDTELLYE